jgi:hypothetical protein
MEMERERERKKEGVEDGAHGKTKSSKKRGRERSDSTVEHKEAREESDYFYVLRKVRVDYETFDICHSLLM